MSSAAPGADDPCRASGLGNTGNLARGVQAGRDFIQISGESPPHIEVRPVERWTQELLGVRPSILGTGYRGNEPPRYFERAHDHELVDKVRYPWNSPRLVLAAGDVSTGKTRSCWEAVRKKLPQWSLLRIVDPDQLNGLGGNRPIQSKSVIWLDDVGGYLVKNPKAVADLYGILLTEVSEVLIIGTALLEDLKATHYPGDGREDRCRLSRILLYKGLRVDIPTRFTEDECRRASDPRRARLEPRLALAVKTAGSTREVIQVLSGGFMLRDRIKDVSPDARALIFAAMDARRLKIDTPLPWAVLQMAAAGYLESEVGRTRRLKLKSALRTWRRGEIEVLQKTRAGFVLHEYAAELGRETRGGIPVNGRLWEAIATLDLSIPDRRFLSREAERRGLFGIAWQLGLPLARAGDTTTIGVIARQLERCGHSTTEDWWRSAVDRDDSYAMTRLAEMLEQKGDVDGARRHWGDAAALGDFYAVFHQADRLRRAGAARQAHAQLEELAEKGDPYVLKVLIRWYREDGRKSEIPDLLGRLRRNDRLPTAQTLWTLAELYPLTDHDADLIRLKAELTAKASAGYAPAMCQLAALLDKDGHHQRAGELWMSAAAMGSRTALTALVQRAADDTDGDRVLVDAAGNGDSFAMARLADRLDRRGNLEEADRWWWRAANLGDPAATRFLGRRLADRRETAAATALYFRALENGQPDMLARLANLVGTTERKRLVQYGIEPGGVIATPWTIEPGPAPRLRTD